MTSTTTHIMPQPKRNPVRPAPSELGPNLSLIRSSGTVAGSFNERPFARGKHSGPHAILSPTASQHTSTAITASIDETLVGDEYHSPIINDRQSSDLPSSTTETSTATRPRPRSVLASISLLGSHLSEVAASWNRAIFNKGTHTSSMPDEAAEAPIPSKSASKHSRTSDTPRSSKNHESQDKPSQVEIAAPRRGRPTTRSMTMSRRSESSRRTSPRLAEKRRLEQTDLHDTYEAIRAWTSDIPKEKIEHVKHWIGQVKRVMEDRSEEDKREMIEPLGAMVAAVEEAMGLAENAQGAAVPKTEVVEEEAKEAEPTGDEVGPSQLVGGAQAEPAPGVKRKRMLRKITPNMNFMLPTPPNTGPKAKRMKSNVSEGAQQDEAAVGEEGGWMEEGRWTGQGGQSWGMWRRRARRKPSCNGSLHSPCGQPYG
ncbi:hypothetical protein LTR17_016093 [Elasticomyces elasticus]|nr:hypothetical protein LTR17_016093 [Elasticomyces elasticus]